MKQFYKIIIALAILFVSLSIQLSAQNFNLIDINAAKDANPSNNSVFDQPMNDFLYGKFEYAVLNNIAYFTADDGIHGAELWRSDATAAGTKMVKDIHPGIRFTGEHDIPFPADKIFFSADDGDLWPGIWVSNGTDAGTFMLKDISPFGNSSPSYLIDANGTLYFFANNISTADQLWKTDGTAAGTVLVADFYSPDFSFSNTASHLTNVNGRLFFGLFGSTGVPNSMDERWNFCRHNLVKDINPFDGSIPTSLTALNGLLLFFRR